MANTFYIFNGLIFKTGTKVTANWGACYPTEDGTIVGFEPRPATHFHSADVLAIIEWADGGQSKEEISRIHELGYRSKNGSPIGIFIA